jgi:hypothetical protein
MKLWINAVEPNRGWTPPPGLARSRPREVRLSAGGVALVVLGLLLAAGGAAGAAALAVMARRDARNARLLEEHGVAAEAVVTSLGPTRGEKARKRATYRYVVDGHAFDRTLETSERHWRTLRVGSAIAVRYLPSQPAIHAPLGRRPRGVPAWVPALVAGPVIFLSALCLLSVAGQRRLLAEGRTAPGRVTRHSREHHTPHGGNMGKTFHYEFPLLSGARSQGKSGPSKNPPAIGSTVCVLYDPERPRRNAVYPLSLVRLA